MGGHIISVLFAPVINNLRLMMTVTMNIVC